MTARWLESLEVGVRGPAWFSEWQVSAEPPNLPASIRLDFGKDRLPDVEEETRRVKARAPAA